MFECKKFEIIQVLYNLLRKNKFPYSGKVFFVGENSHFLFPSQREETYFPSQIVIGEFVFLFGLNHFDIFSPRSFIQILMFHIESFDNSYSMMAMNTITCAYVLHTLRNVHCNVWQCIALIKNLELTAIYIKLLSFNKHELNILNDVLSISVLTRFREMFFKSKSV